MAKSVRVVNLKVSTKFLIIALPNGDIIDIVRHGNGYYVDHRGGVNSDSFGTLRIPDGAVPKGK